MEATPEVMDKTTRRRLAKKAKKLRLAKEKEEKKQLRLEKKQRIVQKIREKRQQERLEQQQAKNAGVKWVQGTCWICGEQGHSKQHCPNKDADNINKTCLHCRKHGHVVKDCPEKADQQENVCFNCGSSKHALRNCRREKIKDGFSFAVCFLCKEKGHLSSQCSKSTQGIYPKGGCCKVCSSIFHLARDCPEAQAEKEQVTTNTPRNNDTSSTIPVDPNHVASFVADQNVSGDALDSDIRKPTKSKASATSKPRRPKVVKF